MLLLGKVKERKIEEDVLLDVIKERERAKIGVTHASANLQGRDAPILLVSGVVTRLQTLELNVMHIVEVNAHIVMRIAVVVMRHSMMRTGRSATHMRRSATERVQSHMLSPLYQLVSADLN